MEESKVPTADVMSLLDMLERKEFSVALGKCVLMTMAQEGKTPKQVVGEVAMQKLPSEEHTTLVRAVVLAITDFHTCTRDQLIERVMRYTAGKAHPMAIQIVLKERGL